MCYIEVAFTGSHLIGKFLTRHYHLGEPWVEKMGQNLLFKDDYVAIYIQLKGMKYKTVCKQIFYLYIHL